MLSHTVDSLVRHRRFHTRLANGSKAAKLGTVNTIDKYEIFSVQGPESLYRQTDSMKQALKVADQAATQFPGTTISIWSPTRAHVLQQVASTEGTITRLGTLTTPADLVEELLLYINSTPQLTNQLQLIQTNQQDLMDRGTYDGNNAVKGFWPVADEAVARYKDQYGGTMQEQYPHDIRRLVAERLVALFEQSLVTPEGSGVGQQVGQQAAKPGNDSNQSIQIPADALEDDKTITININVAQQQAALAQDQHENV